jgi:parallel beta-helix repeat protein
MRTKLVGKIILALLLLSLLHITFAEEVPRIFVNPSTIGIYIGQTFSINVTVANVTDLHAIDIKLRYDTNILDALQLTVVTPWPANHTGIYDSSGYVWINSTLSSLNSINGTTTIAQVTFKGTASGTSILSLADTMMLNSTSGMIAFTRKDGTVNVTLFVIRVPYDYAKIQDAINAANPGETIIVYEGIYKENISLNKSIVLLAENLNAIIDGGNTTTVVTITASNIILKGFTIKNGTIGLNILSSGNTIQGNLIIFHDIGMRIYQAGDNLIANNTFTQSTTGVSITRSNAIQMIGNKVSLNNQGIFLENSIYLIMENNKILNNTNGIKVQNSSDSKIVRNKIQYNENGLSLINSTNNLILRNNFVNKFQLTLQNSSNNIWGNGIEGNYWSDYAGEDKDGDGVGDTNLPHNGVDHYPLINPYVSGDINHDRSIDSADMGLLGIAWGAFLGNPNWNAACDLNEDEAVDGSDLGWMGINWGTSF